MIDRPHVVKIKRKNQPSQDVYSEGTAVQSSDEGWVLTLTMVEDSGEKRGMKVVLKYEDKFTFKKFNKRKDSV